MSYHVEWRPSAEQQLAGIWTDARDKSAVTGAADAIDDELRKDPFALSESRQGSRRILVIPPLAVIFTVDKKRRRVTVLAVWRWGRQP
jgi:plasmid stabilization system protein ParE